MPPGTSQMRELQSSPSELTVEDIVARTGDPARTVRARVATWAMRQDDPTLPRVRRAKVRGDERWCYRVDEASYEAFALGQLRDPALPPCASHTARLMGCSCALIDLHDGRGAVIASSCPVHGALVRAG
jgi:hypothetical protein